MEINNMSLAVWLGEDRLLKDRFSEHRRTIDNPNNKFKPTTAAENFLSSPNHTANDSRNIVHLQKINLRCGVSASIFFFAIREFKKRIKTQRRGCSFSPESGF